MLKGTQLSPEQKERMLAGQKAARERRQAERAAQSAAAAEAVAALGDEAPPAPALGEDAAARRLRLLGDLDPETAALVTDDELLLIEREEHDKAIAEQKKQALADIRARVRQEARAEHDLIPASQLRSEAETRRLSEKLEIRFRLPGEGSGHRGVNGFRINGAIIPVEQWVKCTRAQYESILSNHYAAHLNEVMFKTLDQHKPGGSAKHVLAHNPPMIEVREARHVA